jgi:hypothetical protein
MDEQEETLRAEFKAKEGRMQGEIDAMAARLAKLAEVVLELQSAPKFVSPESVARSGGILGSVLSSPSSSSSGPAAAAAGAYPPSLKGQPSMDSRVRAPLGPLEGGRCTASGLGLKGSAVDVGKPVSFTIMTYRSAKKPGNDLFDIVFRTQPDGAMFDCPCSVVDKRDGSHTVTYSLPMPALMFSIAVDARLPALPDADSGAASKGTAIKGSPFTVTCS